MAPAVPNSAVNSNDSEIFGLPRWAWAAIAGGVVFAGIAAYIIAGDDSDSRKSKKKANKGQKKTPATSGKSTPVKKTVTVEDDPDDDDINEDLDPLAKAVAAKNKGNKYFRGARYELAIDCYTKAIEVCPEVNKSDLATFHQNRAAAYEQLDNDSAVIADCSIALKNNIEYVKAMERRARVLRKQTERARKGEFSVEQYEDIVKKLKTALEDVTAACILGGFQNQENMVLVNSIIKDLGSAESKLAVVDRTPTMCSANFVRNYFLSFAEDPITNFFDEKKVNGHVNGHDADSKIDEIRRLVRNEEYDKVIASCDDVIDGDISSGDEKRMAKLFRATFRIMMKQPDLAAVDLADIVGDEDCDKKVRVNGLIKMASLCIQRCKDPAADPAEAMATFDKAQSIDPEHIDIYHHRGQVHLLLEQIDKASQDFDKAVEINPDFPIAYVQKLYTDYRKATMKNDQAAVKVVIKSFEEAKEKFPDCVETYSLLAQILQDQSRFEEAIKLYEEAEKVDPKNGTLLVHQGLVKLQSTGDIVKGVELITRAIDIDDKCEFAYETLGTVEVQRGNLAKSIELFEKAITLSNTELEMANLFGLRDAAQAQMTVSARLGLR